MTASKLTFILLIFTLFFACSSSDTNSIQTPYKLNITFEIDPNAQRLDNLGNPVSVASGNAAQSPIFETLGLHFIGLFPDKFTPYDEGITLAMTPTTENGGIAAIDFDQELFFNVTNNSISIDLNDLQSGTYEYLRASIGFQKYQITYNLSGASSNPNWPNGISDNVDVNGTIASFLGYNTYINNYIIVNQEVAVNANKPQGYFGLETTGNIEGYSFNNLTEGDAPQTTVPNPINATSPVPEGSCVVTGKFPEALIIPDQPTEDINIKVIISINNSFEWEDNNQNGKYEPLLNEQVIDMGTRGFFPTVIN